MINRQVLVFQSDDLVFEIYLDNGIFTLFSNNGDGTSDQFMIGNENNLISLVKLIHDMSEQILGALEPEEQQEETQSED